MLSTMINIIIDGQEIDVFTNCISILKKADESIDFVRRDINNFNVSDIDKSFAEDTIVVFKADAECPCKFECTDRIVKDFVNNNEFIKKNVFFFCLRNICCDLCGLPENCAKPRTVGYAQETIWVDLSSETMNLLDRTFSASPNDEESAPKITCTSVFLLYALQILYDHAHEGDDLRKEAEKKSTTKDKLNHILLTIGERVYNKGKFNLEQAKRFVKQNYVSMIFMPTHEGEFNL